MPIDFDELLDDDDSSVIDPRDIFLTLDRDKAFALPRDILNRQKQINELLASHGFNGDEFLKRYTTVVK